MKMLLFIINSDNDHVNLVMMLYDYMAKNTYFYYFLLLVLSVTRTHLFVQSSCLSPKMNMDVVISFC